MPGRISFGGSTIEGCRAAIEQDLRRSNPLTAIFAATYYATLGAVKAINALDLAFPDEISLLGFEHSEWMMAIRPYISAVRQSVDDLAAVSWRTLRNRIAGELAELVRVLLDFRCEFRELKRSPAMIHRPYEFPSRTGNPLTTRALKKFGE